MWRSLHRVSELGMMDDDDGREREAVSASARRVESDAIGAEMMYSWECSLYRRSTTTIM